ncbi:MAG: hypothetical protein R3F02_02980 [Thiolinea sp.]
MGSFPGLTHIDYRDLPDGRWQPETLSDQANAAGKPPRPLLYLWVFERPNSLCGQLVTHGWAFLGPVHLLVSPVIRANTPLAISRQFIDQAAQQFNQASGHYRCPKLIDYEHRPTYYGYPINYLWCTDKTWEYGFQVIAKKCHYFVMDLSARSRPDGLVTEIHYLFRHVPLSRVIFLLDTYRTNDQLVSAFIREAWEAMPADAVNAGRLEPLTLIRYQSSSMKYLAQATLSLWTGKAKVPLAQRAAQWAGWV